MRIRRFLISAAVAAFLLTVSLAAAQPRQDLLRDAQGNLPSRTTSPADDDKGSVGSLTGRTSSAATTAELLSLGSAWQVTEGQWSGTWTRRPGTNVFDARWRHTNGSRAQDVITLLSWNKSTNEVVLQRQKLSGAYRGKLNPSARTVTGGTASWYRPGETWSARY